MAYEEYKQLNKDYMKAVKELKRLQTFLPADHSNIHAAMVGTETLRIKMMLIEMSVPVRTSPVGNYKSNIS